MLNLRIVNLSVLGVICLASCTGTNPVTPSDSANSPVSSEVISPSSAQHLDASEVSSLESEYAMLVDAWGEDGVRAIAQGAGVDVRHVPQLLKNQDSRTQLSEELQQKYPNDFTAVWATGDLQDRIQVSAKSAEVLEFAKEKNPLIQTHLVKYSYKEMEAIYDKVHGIVYDQLNGKSIKTVFVGFDPINVTIHLGLDGLDDEQKQSQPYRDLQQIMKEHGDLIKPSTDFERWGPGEAEAA